MSQFNYLTGRKELFDNAPDEAMVVLETHDGQIYYAVSHNRGARYWYDNGNPGRPAGLIALFEKTRVIASRALVAGLPPEQPKRDPIPKSRLDRMQQAQNGLRKAVSQPAPVKVDLPKVTPKKAPERAVTQANFSPCAKCGAVGLHACPGVQSEPVKWTNQDKHRLTDAIENIRESEANPSGFVSIFALGTKRGTGSGTFLTLYRNGNIGLSAKVPFVTGDVVDVQVDFARGLIRVGKVSAGGRALPKSRTLTNKALVDTFKMPEGRSLRIYLTEANGWWQGQVELAGVPK